MREHGVKVDSNIALADAVILAVPHDQFISNGWHTVLSFTKPDARVVVMDVKGVLPREKLPENVDLWRP